MLRNMDISPLFQACISFFFSLCFIYILISRRREAKNPPPSPAFAIPVLGHLHLLQPPLHITLFGLSEKYGPVLSLRLGSRPVLVVSSASIAEECFTKNDILFADRPHTPSGKYITFDYTLLVAASYGDYWRNLRRVCALDIFSPARLTASVPIRKHAVNRLLCRLYKEATSAGGGGGCYAKLGLRSNISEFSLDVIVSMVAGMKYCGEDKGAKFRELIARALEFSENPNASDFLPFLKWVNYRDYEKGLAKFREEMEAFLQGLIDEERVEKSSENTLVNHLVSRQESQPEQYNDKIIRGLIMIMLLGGTSSSTATLEWAMTLLLNHPDSLKKARDELDSQVGLDRLVEEQDLPNLPYILGIILETLRLYPTAPLLLPHESSDHCKVAGYDVPRGTMLLVNVWSIHRDPKTWDDPLSFKPERFGRGQEEERKVLAFGMGRRSCAGSALARRVLGLALGSLIQCFDWERTSTEKIDVAEEQGVVNNSKANPLEALCKPRHDCVGNILQELSASS